MDFAANFTAIDFETANRRPDSACQLAAVVVRQGRMVDQAMWMIRPEPLYFSRTNIQIHGITPQQVRQERSFGEIWPEISEILADDCLVAHNASFDIGVLLACLGSHDHPVPDLQFTCTRAIARRTWPHHRRYGLKPLANWLGIRFRHHDALEDSIACAKILLAAGIDQEATTLVDLEKRLRLSRGKAGPWGHRGPTGRTRRTRRRAKANADSTGAAAAKSSLPFLFPHQLAEGSASYSAQATGHDHSQAEPAIDFERLMIRAEFIRPLSGMEIVFSGRFRLLSRQQAEALAERSGGTCSERVNESTDYVVVGGEDPRGTAEINDVNLTDRSIQILNEEEFFGLVTTRAGRSAGDEAGSGR